MKYMSLVLYTSYLHSHCAALPSKLHWGPPFSPHVALPPHALLPPLREQYIYHSLPPPDNWHLTDEDSADSFWLLDHRWCPNNASGGHLTVLPQDDNSIRSQSLLPPSNSFTASLHLAAFRAVRLRSRTPSFLSSSSLFSALNGVPSQSKGNICWTELKSHGRR